ncbi:hypothetical protein SGQ83_02105 [Flavobacterium sp. Fl-318]|uniref:Uncharacterized protein n=1 Tax=Flavobacterium cupriresistens TaxID=2893885 RepID=A0ABU4R6C1_9FLAO|nr:MULTISPECIES: hypothetical protein [unclassified Flavobacterium]MDX6188127.1 hypothetical protein [Flavobacterium sp. Fl-318]UFH41952.1 hypothetical protein LNP23_19345 [Flavobacterium sp. F-323]
MRTIITRVFVFFTGCMIQAQIVQKIGNNPTQLNISAALEVESTNKGFLPPRMTTAERNVIVSAAIGLIIYNTTTNVLEIWDGKVWYNTSASGQYVPLAGGTMTGSLLLPADPTLNLEAATKHYVDTKVAAVPATSDATVTATGKIQLAGDLTGTASLPTVKAASLTQAGKVQLATATETTLGTSTTVAVQPAGLKVELDKKAPIVAPTFSGDAKAVTAFEGDDDTSIATTGFVTTAVTNGKDNLGNHTATQDLNIAGKNLIMKDRATANTKEFQLYKNLGRFTIYNKDRNFDELFIDETTGRTTLSSLAITKGSDRAIPIIGQVATAADASGNVVWKPTTETYFIYTSNSSFTLSTTISQVVMTDRLAVNLSLYLPNNAKPGMLHRIINLSDKTVTIYAADDSVSAHGTINYNVSNLNQWEYALPGYQKVEFVFYDSKGGLTVPSWYTF